MIGGFFGILCSAAVFHMKNRQYRYQGEGAVSTPFAEALAQVVGIAGGIYLSLVLLCDFLGMDVPKQVGIWGTNIDILALISLLLACIQPMILWILRRR